MHPYSFVMMMIRSSLFILMTLVTTNTLLALESDRDQPIEIESDSAEFREVEGITVYTGNVRMSQGSILLLADKITIYTSEGNVDRLVAQGDKAYYEQKPSETEEKVVAQGRQIEYRLADDIITMVDGASLTQEGSATLTGNRIAYDVRKHLLVATGVESKKERVRVTIPTLNPLGDR